MKKHSYETTIEVNEEIIKNIEKLFGDDKEYNEKQKRFQDAAIKDALSYLYSNVKHDGIPKGIWEAVTEIAVSQYIQGFNRAFAYYVEHEDIFNLENNEDTKQD